MSVNMWSLVSARSSKRRSGPDLQRLSDEYELVKEGDRIAVCISGGKDSMLMAKLFQELKRHNKFPFEVEFLVMDPGYSEANRAGDRRTMPG